MANLSTSLNRQLRSIGRGPSKPSWWVLFQVAAGAVVFAVMAWQMMSVDTSTNRVISVRPVAPATVPASTSGTTTPDTSVAGQETLASVEGGQVSVPAAAVAAAKLAFEGSGDPAVARTVPMSAGETFPVPTQSFPNAKVGPLQVSTHTEDLITFVATFDADGKGPGAADFLPWTVVREGESWVVTLRSE